jgi:hypothetical protein
VEDWRKSIQDDLKFREKIDLPVREEKVPPGGSSPEKSNKKAKARHLIDEMDESQVSAVVERLMMGEYGPINGYTGALELSR